MVLKTLAVLGRLGAISSSIIVLGINAKLLVQGSWLKELLIYIEAMAGLSVIAAFVPPYPNFLYDSFFGAAWIVAAIFALVTQFAESNCYGLRPESQISCAMYKATTAFAFISLFAWLGCAFLGGLRILGLLANVGDRYWGRPLYLGANKETETVPPEKLRKVEGAGNSHIARWFICYGLLGVAIIAVGIPLLVIYAGPAFAEYLILGLPMPDNVRMELKNPTNDSIGASVTSDVRVPATGEITFSPMNVSFFSADDPDFTPIASVDLPKLKYGSEAHLNIAERRLKLKDLDAFARFIKTVAFNPSFTLGGRARAKIKIGAISTSVDLQKTVDFKGFNAFPGLNITELSLKKPDENGYNLHAEIAINNPTPTSATFGNVTLNVLVGGIILGEASTSVANIISGKNTFDVNAKLNVTNLRNNMETILKTEIPYLKNETILASASVKSVVYDGQHLAYWEEAFGRLEVTLTRPVRPLVRTILDSGFLPGYIGSFVGRALDTILDNVKEMKDADLEKYTGTLGDSAKTALGLLSTFGIL